MGDDLGAHVEFFRGELSRVLASDFLSRPDSLPPLACFGSGDGIPKVVAFLRDLTHGKGFDTLPAVIAFPEFYRASSWAKAVSFLSMGFAVQIGTHLPFWGSPSLTEVLTKDWPKVSEGVLMARASLPDGQTQADELLSFLRLERFSRNRKIPLAPVGMKERLRQYVIVGNSAAGISAAKEIRRYDPIGQITMLSDELTYGYSRVMLPLYIAKKISKRQMTIAPRTFYSSLKIRRLRGEPAEAIDPRAQKVHTRKGRTLPYDYLLIATGSLPTRLRITGIGLEGIHSLRKV